ncbi:MAG: hypothetical protein ACOYMN_07915, partial [Roseimicrobium sp.]
MMKSSLIRALALLPLYSPFSSHAAESLWGGGIGFSDVGANWVGGQVPPPENSLRVNGGKMKGRGLAGTLLNVAAGAEAYALIQGGMGISLNGPSADTAQVINGKLIIGEGAAAGLLELTGASYFTGTGEIVLSNDLCNIIGAGELIVGQGLSLHGVGTIATNTFYANTTVTADVNGGTLEINTGNPATLTKGVAANGGVLKLTAPLVEGISTLDGDLQIVTAPTLLESQPGSEIIITSGTKIGAARLARIGTGKITFEGESPTLARAGLNGDWTFPGDLVVEQELDLRDPDGAGPVTQGRLFFTGGNTGEQHGFIFVNDFDGDLDSDGPTRILGGEIVLNGANKRAVGTFGSSGAFGMELAGAKLVGQGTVTGGLNLSTFESQLVATNPANAPLGSDPAPRQLEVTYYWSETPVIENAGVIGAINGGHLRLVGLTVTNKSDGGSFPGGAAHPVGYLQVTENSSMYLGGCDMPRGSVNVTSPSASFTFHGGHTGRKLGGTGETVIFNGPGQIQLGSIMSGELFATTGTTVSFEEVYSSGNVVVGDLLLNGPGTFRLNGAYLSGSGLLDSTDTLTINGRLEGSGYISNFPVHVRPGAVLSGDKIQGQVLHLSDRVLNEGLIVASPSGDPPLPPLVVESSSSIENVNGGNMLLQGSLDLYGKITGGQISAVTPLRCFGGTLKNVTLTKVGDPNSPAVVAHQGFSTGGLILDGTISNNAVIRVPDTLNITLTSPVTLSNLVGLTGRVEMGAYTSIDDENDSLPVLTLGPRQSLVARPTEAVGDPEGLFCNVY